MKFFNQLNIYRKTVQKFHYHRRILFKIKWIIRYKSLAIYFMKSPDLCLPMSCIYIWKYLNSRITAVSTLSSLFQFQSYFSDLFLVNFTHKYFFQVGWTHSFHIKFSVSNNKFGVMQDMSCFWRMSQQKCFF